MGFGLLPSPALFWLANDVYRALPPPQEFTLGPTCLVVKGRAEGRSILDFLSSIASLWLPGKHLHLAKNA